MSAGAIPTWVIRAVVMSMIGALVTGASAWGIHLSTKSNIHETRITVVEEKVGEVKQDIKDLKTDQKEMREELNRKLDRLLEQRRKP